MVFDGNNLEARGADELRQFRLAKYAGIGGFANHPHRGQDEPEKRIHLPDARRLGDEKASRCEQGVDAGERDGQGAHQVQIIESEDDIEGRRLRHDIFRGRSAKNKIGDGFGRGFFSGD